MTRRSLIQRAFLLLGIERVALIGCASSRIASETSRPVEATLALPSESQALSMAEMESLVAFSEVLVEGRALPPVERQYLLDHIQDRTTGSPEYLLLYRDAVHTLDRLAGRRFASLGVRERIDLIARHRLAAPVRAGEDLGPYAEEIRTLRIRTTRDLIRGYYGSPAGWAVVSYDSFPGRCGDLTRYTRPEG